MHEPRLTLDPIFMTTIHRDDKMLSGWQLASSRDDARYEVYATGSVRTWYGARVRQYRLEMVAPRKEPVYEGRKKDVLYILGVLLVDTVL
jgi:hypothetical protein